MHSYGLIAMIALFALAGMLISYRLATIAIRLVRMWLLRRATTLLLPAVRPEPRSLFVPATAAAHSAARTTPLLATGGEATRRSSPPIADVRPASSNRRAS